MGLNKSHVRVHSGPTVLVCLLLKKSASEYWFWSFFALVDLLLENKDKNKKHTSGFALVLKHQKLFKKKNCLGFIIDGYKVGLCLFLALVALT